MLNIKNGDEYAISVPEYANLVQNKIAEISVPKAPNNPDILIAKMRKYL
jgi:hypothetical protein